MIRSFFLGFEILYTDHIRYSASHISTSRRPTSDYAAAVLVANCRKQTL